MISLDCETTGVDFNHGSRPFFVTTCDDSGNVRYWDWMVDPLTRMPCVYEDDLVEIADVLREGWDDGLVLQNPKFDFTALGTVGLWKIMDEDEAWPMVRDTLLAGHLLASNHLHDLTSMGVEYLGVDNQHYEKDLNKTTEECRRYCRTHLPDWRIATKDDPMLPSAGATLWRNDLWLAKAVADHLGIPPDDEAKGHYHTVLADYANSDSAVTLALWKAQLEAIRRRGLERIYMERLKLLPVARRMESRGVTLSKDRLTAICAEYGDESEARKAACEAVAASYEHWVECRCVLRPPAKGQCSTCKGERKHRFTLEMPAGATPNNSLRTFMFDVMGLPPVSNKKARTDAPTLNAEAMAHYAATLDEGSGPHTFVTSLLAKRKRDTAVQYMTSYRRFWLKSGRDDDDTFVLHPSLNPTGTWTLRWSSSNPNEQNISKKEGFNIRYCFGPARGREWWSLDAKNIELRIPAYASGEQEMIDLFERPDDPPYYGSNHILVFHILWPDLWDKAALEVGHDKAGPYCKKKYASTYYQWVKNGNFAVQYGAVDREDGTGTADRAYHQPGGQAKIKARFSKLTALNDERIRLARKYGYVETMPDKTVDPDRGYPLLCTRTEWGEILPTVPLNYYVQGTAMWWTSKAMVRCDDQLTEWTMRSGGAWDGFLLMQVHDECVFDLPRRADPRTNPKASNLGRVRQLQKLMERGGDDIGIPTPVGVEYHPNNWSEGIVL